MTPQPVRRRASVGIARDVAFRPAVHLTRRLPPPFTTAAEIGLLDEPDRSQLAEVVARRACVRPERRREGGGCRRSARPEGAEETGAERMSEDLERSGIEAKRRGRRMRHTRTVSCIDVMHKYSANASSPVTGSRS